MTTPRSGLSFSPLRLLALLAAVVLVLPTLPAAAGDLDWIGPAGLTQADGPAQLAQGCPRIYRPVCAYTRNRWRTYSNSCLARRAGARRIRNGACRTTTQRVCCQRGRRHYLTNRRSCRRAGGRVVAARRCRVAPPPQRTCHQRATSRRYRHIRGRSWHPACRTAPPPQRSCHQRATSRRYPHIRGRSWNPACRAAGGRPRPKPKPQAGAPCTGKDRHGVPFQGRIFVDRNGIAVCMGDSSGRMRP